MDWPNYPFDHTRHDRVSRDTLTINAVRRCIPDWDGDNWIAVREYLRAAGRTPDELRAMSIFDIRMAFATGQVAMVRLLGKPETNTGTIQEFNPTTQSVDEVQAPALTKPEQLTLRALATFDPSVLASVRQIADAMDRGEAIAERTITPALRKLVKCGLAERPEGDRQGARLTLKGRRLAAKIAD